MNSSPSANLHPPKTLISTSCHAGDSERESEKSLRPLSFADFPGQETLKNNLAVYVQASKIRNTTLDHVLLHGPPGLGKTTLAHIIAQELEVPFYATSGPAIEKPRDLVGVLTGLEDNSVLFIDEIHRLFIQAEEILYTAMEDFSVDLIVGEGGSARSVRISVPPFTLVGATTKAAMLSKPLLSRFGIQEKLDYYDLASIEAIIQRSAHVLGIHIHKKSLKRLAECSRGTPRVAIRFLKRVWDFAEVHTQGEITEDITNSALTQLGIRQGSGLSHIDITILQVIKQRYNGGPVGIEAIAMAMGEEAATIEDVYEPYLVFCGYLVRTPRGRVLSDSGKALLSSSQ
ncbi:MAG: Holliday junction branch migration DNA helicase RuvB [Proteobacteria bacterium]|nr:Holliday junction branch migration DNA helicase RuvB [Pseudomonadota bacterium]